MEIVIKTKVKKNHFDVYNGFTKDLFIDLSPPFIPFDLIKFDGCNVDDEVIVKLNFILFKQNWVSKIIDNKQDKDEIYFIDKGIKLPFFLKFWRHEHRILNGNDNTIIIDHIYYKTPFILLNYLMYPVMFMIFYYRKNIYTKRFS